MNELNYTCISIHAPPRGATVELSAITGLPYISIHAPPRGATGCCRGRCSARAISIHAPPRGATVLPRRNRRCTLISIHAPPRGATYSGGEMESLSKISIHAPPRGATQLVHLCRCHLLFQFTPLREGRPAPTQCAGQRHYFNSRPSARGDVAGFLPFLHLLISIHAPPRGATLRQPRGGCRHRISIHAPPRGAFQFTPLREGRPVL